MEAIVRKIVDSELTKRQREIYLLYYEEGLAQVEIAKKMRTNRSTICRTLQRAERTVVSTVLSVIIGAVLGVLLAKMGVG